MKKNVLLFLLQLCSFSMFADWTQLVSGTTVNLNDVYFTDNDHGWVVGKSGTIRHTTDGGVTWSAQTSGTTKELKSICFTDANTGWAAGKDGVIKHTSDAGATWTTQTTGVSKDLNAIHFMDASNGMAVGEDGIILSTTNGGISWVIRAAGTGGGSGSGEEEESELSDVQMTSTQTAYACGNAGLFVKTTDGGASWTTQTTGVTEDFSALHFPSSGNGYVCYESGKVKYTTGAGTFTSVYAATSKDLYGIWFVNDQKGWVVGDEGRILYTLNGGSSWTSQNLATVVTELRAVQFPSNTTGYCVGEEGVILKLINADAVSVNDLPQAAPAFTVFPNPSGDVITLQAVSSTFTNGEPVIISVFDAFGKLIYEEKTANITDFKCAVNSWSNGVYTIRMIADKKVVTTKFIKQ